VTVQQHHQPHIADQTTSHKFTSHDAIQHDATQHNATQHDPIQHDSTQHDTNKKTPSHENYFKEKFGNLKPYRLQRLIRTANTFATSEELQFFCKPNNTRVSPRDQDPIMQAIAMYRKTQQLTEREYLIYFADAVERCALSGPKEASKQTNISAALNQIKEQLNKNKKEVVERDCLGRRYLACMENGGAACLYSMHCSPSE
jgi:hypothetical protein